VATRSDYLSNTRIDSERPGRQAIVPVAASEPWRDPEWQRLWLAVENRQWRSLALIPAGDGASVDFSLIVAVTLSRTGMVHLGRPVQVADATQVPLAQLSRFLAEVQRLSNEGERLLVALPPIGSSPITASIAQAVDAAVLCVLYEKMSASEAKKTVRSVGHARFLGSAIFHQHEIAAADRVR
jgi:hypothetical protein